MIAAVTHRKRATQCARCGWCRERCECSGKFPAPTAAMLAKGRVWRKKAWY